MGPSLGLSGELTPGVSVFSTCYRQGQVANTDGLLPGGFIILCFNPLTWIQVAPRVPRLWRSNKWPRGSGEKGRGSGRSPRRLFLPARRAATSGIAAWKPAKGKSYFKLFAILNPVPARSAARAPPPGGEPVVRCPPHAAREDQRFGSRHGLSRGRMAASSRTTCLALPLAAACC